MKNLFINYFKTSILTSLIFMIFGLILFINPEDFIAIISIVMGLFILLYGIIELSLFIKSNYTLSYALVVGIFTTVSGILLISNTNIIATIIPLIIGISLICLGVEKIQLSIDLKERKVIGYKKMFFVAILTLFLGILLISNPLKGAFMATKLVGIIIILYSTMDIINSMVWKNNITKVSKIIEGESYESI